MRESGIIAGVFALSLGATACGAPAASIPTVAAVQTPAAVAQPTTAPAAIAVATSVPTTPPATQAQLSPTPLTEPTAPAPVASTAQVVPTAAPTVAQASPAQAPPVPAPATASPRAAPTVLPAPPAKPAVPLTTLSFAEKGADFQSGQMNSASLVAGEGVRLAGSEGSFASAGEYLSTEREAEFPFNNVVLSWNADAPAGTSARFEVRVRDAAGWSNWYAMGEWRPDGGRSVSGQSDSRGRVDVDTLKLTSPAQALQFRVKMSSSSPAASPLVRQVAVVYSDLRKGLTGPALPRVPAAVRDLNVPQQSQLEEDSSYRSLICSATSLAMLMQYWGLDKSVPQVVAGVKDRTSGIYGNWPLNTAFAAANGFDARIERFYSVEQLEQEIAAGRPVAISIAFNPGELSASPISSTDGHLIVVRGFTPEGNVIVNDPIAANDRSVRLVYNRQELSRIWLRSGGVVYLVSPRAGGPLAR